MTLTAVGTRYVYDFDEEAPGGRAQLGGKGLGLSRDDPDGPAGARAASP